MFISFIPRQDLGANPWNGGSDHSVLVRGRERGAKIPRALIRMWFFCVESDVHQVLFIGVMSCMYVLWDVIGQTHVPRNPNSNTNYLPVDDTIARKVNSSDASAFAKICGCFPSQGLFFLCEFPIQLTLFSTTVWGVIWLLVAFIFFAGGILVGLAAFKVPASILSNPQIVHHLQFRSPPRSRNRTPRISSPLPGPSLPRSPCPPTRY